MYLEDGVSPETVACLASPLTSIVPSTLPFLAARTTYPVMTPLRLTQVTSSHWTVMLFGVTATLLTDEVGPEGAVEDNIIAIREGVRE